MSLLLDLLDPISNWIYQDQDLYVDMIQVSRLGQPLQYDVVCNYSPRYRKYYWGMIFTCINVAAHLYL